MEGIMMNRFKDILYQVTCGILIFFFGLVFLQTTVNISHMELIGFSMPRLWRPLFLLSGAALLLLLLFYFRRLLGRLPEKRKNGILFLLFCIGIALQLALLFGLRPALQCDALKPVDTAMSMLNGIPLSESEYYEYFSIYPHNLPLNLYIFFIFKIAQILGIAQSNYILTLQLLNLILLDFSLVQLYRLIKRRAGDNAALSYGLLCFFQPLLVYYPVFFYTQTLSIPIFVLMITLFFQILEADCTKKQIFFGSCFGIVLFFGWTIRFFTWITLIAFAMYLFFHKERKRISKKALGITLLSCTILLVGCFTANKAFMTKYSLTTEKEQSFPVQHWIMMGLQGDGSFYYVDEDFTKAIPTKTERADANAQVIRERAEELGIRGVLNLWNRKLALTWADGFDDYASNLILSRHYYPLNDFLSGYRAEYLAAYLHIYNCMSWMFLTICAVMLLKRRLPDFTYVICITILGGMMFHLLWEAGEPYSMPFALLVIGGAALGMDGLSLSDFQKTAEKKRLRTIYGAAAAAIVVSMGCLILTLHGKAFEVSQISAIQNQMSSGYLYLESGETLTQTINCSRPFNTLTLQYKYYGDINEQPIITLRLLDCNGGCITEESLPLSEKITRYDFAFPEVIPKGWEIYTIELTGTQIPAGAKAAFTGYHTGFWDLYPEGKASHNRQLYKNSDLYFELVNKTERTLF